MTGVIGGIFTGIGIEIMRQPVIYEAHAEPLTAIMEPQVVLIEVEIDWTRERIIREIEETFPEDPDTAVRIAKAESELFIKAHNPEAHRNKQGVVLCHGSFGVMQIGCVHNMKDTSELYDVEYNLKKARQIYDDSKARTGNGWLPWGAYTDGRYKQF